MKRIIVAFCILFAGTIFAQNNLPKVSLTTLDGGTINTETFSNDGKPMVISFWATWCKPCMREMAAVKEVYEDWQEELGMKLIAISIDDTRNFAKVGPKAAVEGWEWEVYVDLNQDFKRSMGVNNIPHTFVIDGEGNIAWQHTGYALGDEDELYEVLEKVANGEKVE